MAHGYASPCGTTVLRRKHIPPCPEDPPSRSPPADGQPANLRGVVFAYGKRFGGFIGVSINFHNAINNPVHFNFHLRLLPY